MNRRISGRHERESCLGRRNRVQWKVWCVFRSGGEQGWRGRLCLDPKEPSRSQWGLGVYLLCRLPFLPSALQGEWHGPVGLDCQQFLSKQTFSRAGTSARQTWHGPPRPRAEAPLGLTWQHRGGLDCVLIKFHRICQSLVTCFLGYLTSQGQERTCNGGVGVENRWAHR